MSGEREDCRPAFHQIVGVHRPDSGREVPPGSSVVSWLICTVGGREHTVDARGKVTVVHACATGADTIHIIVALGHVIENA